MKEALHGVKLVYLTMNNDPQLALEAFNRGASAYLLKSCAASEMVLAVREVLRGKTYLSPTLKEKVDYLRWGQWEIVEEANRLTERQRQVLQLLAEGKVMKEIGGILDVSTTDVPLETPSRCFSLLGWLWQSRCSEVYVPRPDARTLSPTV